MRLTPNSMACAKVKLDCEMIHVKDFRVLRIPYFAEIGLVSHNLYIKEHVERDQSDRRGRTLFVGNVDYGEI